MNKFLLQFSNDWFFAYTEPVSRTSCTSSFPSAMSSLGKSLSSDGLPSNHLTLRTRESVQLALSNGVDAWYLRSNSSDHFSIRSIESLINDSSICLSFSRSCLRTSASGFDKYFSRCWCRSGNSDCRRSAPSTLVSLCSLELQAKSYDLFRRTEPKIQKRKFIQSLDLDSRWRCINAQFVLVVLSKNWATILQLILVFNRSISTLILP